MATIKGKWVFNETLTEPNEFTQSVNFVSNVTDYTYIGYTSYDADYDRAVIKYGSTVVFYYDAYSSDWTDDIYRTVDFGTTEQTVSDTFLTWMQNNAVQEQTESEEPTVTISYDGNTLTTVEGGKTVALHCADKMMQGDLEITAPEIPEMELQEKVITENGEITPDEGYDGISKVTVNVPIPDGYIDPEGTIEITENGTYDVTEYADANINIPEEVVEDFDGTIIVENLFETIPEGAIYTIAKTGKRLTAGRNFPISVNDNDSYTYGTYKYTYTTNDNGWKVEINTPKYNQTFDDILESINGVNVTNMNQTFNGCKYLTTAPAIPNSVTNIESTFYGCTALTTPPAVIPEGVTSMNNTFYGCTALTTAPVIPEGVTNIEYAFYGCESLKTYIGAPEGTAYGDFSGYVIPEGVTSMNNTFYNCTYLKTAPVIPESVTNMYYTFAYCKALTTAPVIPEGVTNMDYTFYICEKLTTAPVIPEGVTIMDHTFYGCESLKTYIGAPEGTAYGDFSGYVIPEGVTEMQWTFGFCKALTIAPVIPEGVTNMAGTFGNTTFTTAPVIPEGVTNMNATFSSASLTTAPVIPNSVTNMAGTFRYCTSLKTYIGAPDGIADGDFSAYVIPNGVTNMEDTFNGCTSLTTAPVIPESVTDMSFTFYKCTALTGSITINATPTDYYYCLYNTKITEILGDCGNKTSIYITR